MKGLALTMIRYLQQSALTSVGSVVGSKAKKALPLAR